MVTLIDNQREALLEHLGQLEGQPFQNKKAIIRLVRHVGDKKMDNEITQHLDLETASLANLLLALEELNQ